MEEKDQEKRHVDFRDATVLLVDDEINVLKSLKRLLRMEGYEILTALSGPEGLEIVRNRPVDLIVSDQRMMPMTGIDFLAEVRKFSPHTIRILLTGYSDLSTAEKAINEVEIYRFLTKPWNDTDLKNTIRQGLLKHRLEEENRWLFRKIEQQNLELRRWNETLENMVEERTRQLKEAQAQLIQNEKMASLGLLAGGVAHEINNPLAGILGIAQNLMAERQKDPPLISDLKMIEKVVIHCSGIVKNLLTFSRKADPDRREVVDLRHLVRQVEFLLGHVFRNCNLTLKQDIPPDFPSLFVNSTQFQQVLVNLLVNAQQAMVRDGTITLRARAGEEGVKIEILDQGPGLAEEILDRIFDPFFTTKPEGEGTGLGLSVAYRIVEDHAGRIEAENLPGGGACFRLVFGPDIIALPGSLQPVGGTLPAGIIDLAAGDEQKNA